MLLDRDHVVWHPFTQEKIAPKNIAVVRGEGVWLQKEDGEQVLDGISSWWTNVHGHAHPFLTDALSMQAQTLEHVVFAGVTHPKAVELSEKLIALNNNNFSKVFFSDNGSTANEVALKMAIQFFYNQGIAKTKVIAFQDSYHGDTFGVMSTGGRGVFSAPFDKYLFDVLHLPAPNGSNDDEIIAKAELYLKNGDVAAFAFECLVMGTAGMVMYSEGLLEQLFALCKQHGALTIADEVFTGFYRTGKCFAYQHTNIQPDMMCLSKGLTGGVMAMGVTMCTQEIYDAFYVDDVKKMFSHGHSYTGNPLACAVACASIDLFEHPSTLRNIEQLCTLHNAFAEELKGVSQFENVRTKGTILAFEVKTNEADSYFNSIRDVLYNYFIERNLLLRPLGNTVYFLPPYCITKSEYDFAKKIIIDLAEWLEKNR